MTAAPCQSPGCRAHVFNGHHCERGHLQFRDQRISSPVVSGHELSDAELVQLVNVLELARGVVRGYAAQRRAVYSRLIKLTAGQVEASVAGIEQIATSCDGAIAILERVRSAR